MTSSYPQRNPTKPTAGRIAREVTGLLLTFSGAGGLITVAFTVHPLAGAALVSVLLLLAGLWLASSDT
ncbi:hypothetical protein TR74_06575 [Carbonactinospora thermoautotrophica]|uniref:Uncharacterized protein n=1 Tax=Carbonactinospora thermoautotrophica TaxID=1469144 RepID=A0A132NIN9_9ACTN|nr:hypothetical protein TR74_06575 [Carbonactinospora thermoautotrophica]